MNYEDQLSDVLMLFESSFKQEYKRLTYRKKNKLLRYLISFYRRWYHSALIENTILTPSNIVANLNSEYYLPTDGVPYPVISNNTRMSGFQYKLLNYSLDKHPVVNDLKIFAEHCSPDIELTDYDMPKEDFIEKISLFLSINDPFYVEYICQLALHLKVIKKLPSIYSNKAQLASEFNELFKLNPRDIFTRIFNASIEIATNFLVQSVPIKSKKFSTEFIISVLKEPISTDELFERIYSLLGIDLDNMMNFTGDVFDELYQAMISSTFFLGLLIDRYFFTVFGFYLKIINPGYTLTFDMRNELEYVAEGFREMEDLSSGFFAPCSHYTITELGMELLSLKPNATNTVHFPKKLKISTIISQVIAHINETGSPESRSNRLKALKALSTGSERPENVYLFKVSMQNKKSFWKTIEFDDRTTLEQMYMFICRQFGFDAVSNYSFFVGMDESPFFEYSSPTSKKRTKKTDSETISVLAAVPENMNLLVLYDAINILNGDIMPSKAIKIKLEYVRSAEYLADGFFPNVCKVSTAFRDFEDEF